MEDASARLEQKQMMFRGDEENNKLELLEKIETKNSKAS